jgi:hypothetical protein
MARSTPVVLEQGRRRTFATAVDWPGWCRSGKREEEALEALAAYEQRYRAVALASGTPLPTRMPAFAVVERVEGNATTDFGAPGVVSTHDAAPLTVAQAHRTAALVEAAWRTLDMVAAAAPAGLRKGPRGGGRDRDEVLAHVVAADVAYARKLGLRLAAPDPGDSGAVRAFRQAVLAVLSRASDGTAAVTKGWPPRYAAHRIAWHALDHAWEIEDRSVSGA